MGERFKIATMDTLYKGELLVHTASAYTGETHTAKIMQGLFSSTGRLALELADEITVTLRTVDQAGMDEFITREKAAADSYKFST